MTAPGPPTGARTRRQGIGGLCKDRWTAAPPQAINAPPACCRPAGGPAPPRAPPRPERPAARREPPLSSLPRRRRRVAPAGGRRPARAREEGGRAAACWKASGKARAGARLARLSSPRGVREEGRRGSPPPAGQSAQRAVKGARRRPQALPPGAGVCTSRKPGALGCARAPWPARRGTCLSLRPRTRALRARGRSQATGSRASGVAGG